MRGTFSLILAICFVLVNCSSTSRGIENECLSKQFDLVISNDLAVLTQEKEELLLIVKFVDAQKGIFKAAILDKETFSTYLSGVKEDEAKGYFNHNGLIGIVYGNPPNGLELTPISKDMKFMIPFNPESPKEGMPPLPPMLSIIEPSIYTFQKAKDCYILIQKTIADKLLE